LIRPQAGRCSTTSVRTGQFDGSPVSSSESGREQAENVLRPLAGEPPHGIGNPEVIKTIAVMRRRRGHAGVPATDGGD
jgi:hypothetical protein